MKNSSSQRKNLFLAIIILIISLYFFDVSSVIEYMNDKAGAIQGFFTLILVIITAYYAWQTRKTVEIMQKSERERNRPRLSIYIKQREDWVNFVYLVIANYGNDVAKNITFNFNTDFDSTLGDKKLSEIRQIKDGMKNLTSSRELLIPFLNLVQDFDKFKKSNIQITATYYDVLGNKFKDKFTLDITSLIEHQVGKPPVYEISENLKKISENIKNIQKEIKNK